ncbi:MAG: phosphoglucosamine mutase, partial [Thermoplasmatota archaeon]
TMNSQPDGSFPAHDPEPTKKNLKDLGKLVVKTGADIGLAHDGDADRLVAYDSQGNYLGGDQLLALFASQFTDKVVVPINSSMVIEELVNEVIRTKVGDVFVAEQLKEHDAQFGGEASGTWIFPQMSYAPDAIYAAAYLVDLSEKIDLKEKIGELPSYPQERKSFEIKNKEKVMDELKTIYKNRYSQTDLNFVDGIRVEYENGWSLTRRSGTEPKIRITVEAQNQEDLDDIFKKSRSLLEEVTG